MPESLHSPEIDEFDLTELAAIAPANPRLPDSDWELTRDEIRQSITATANRRGSRWPRLAVAAVAIATVGALGYGALSPKEQALTPAAPASSSSSHGPSPSPSPSAFSHYRTIPAGHYLTRTFTMTQVAPLPAADGKPARTEKSFEKRTEWLSADNVYSSTGTTDRGPTSTPAENWGSGRDLTGMPREPKAMRAWAIKHDKVAGDRRADDRIAWEVGTDLFRDMRSTPALRQDLVTMLGQNPNTTISQGTVMGHRAVTLTFRYPAHDGTAIVQTASMDASSMALLRETTKGKVGSTTSPVDYRLVMNSLEREVDHKP